MRAWFRCVFCVVSRCVQLARASFVAAAVAMTRERGARALAEDDGDADVSYVRYGTAMMDVARAGAVQVWAEPVRDSSGRRRFHGAFDGGFSAGYFNTVGSAEGFTPSAFTSSRARGGGGGGGGGGNEGGDGATPRAQSVVDFMDDDEREAYEATTMRTAMEYDTFGREAREAHRRSATQAMGRVGAAVSGALAASAAVLDLVAPRVLSVGARLLTKMGWRRGRGTVLAEGGAFGGDAFGLEDAPEYVREPKTNRHGVGYDPFDGAEEFRDIAAGRKRSRDDENAGMDRGRRRGEAFGLGVFEEEDEALYTEDAPKLSEYAFELEDEEDIDARARARPGSVLALGAALPNDCVVRGFQVSSDTLSPPKWFAPPVIPRDWHPSRRVVAVRPRRDSVATTQPVVLPPEPPAPADEERQKVIDTLAVFVAKHGAQFEEMAKARQGEDKKFSFLFGGKDSGYYKWRLAKATLENAQESEAPPARRARPLGMEERAKILGEELLPSTSSAQREQTAADGEPRKKLSIEGIAASDRERIQKLLTKTFTSAGVVQTAEVEKVGLHMLQKSAPKPTPEKASTTPTPCEASRMPIISSRNTINWAPEPLLCKRFGVPDPYANKTRPDTSQYKFRTDVLELDDTRAKQEADAPKYLDVPPPPPATTMQNVPPPPPPSLDASAQQVNVAAETQSVPPPPATFVEKPIDLFKQIFENSDDDIEEEEDLDLIQAALTTKAPQAPPPPPPPPPPTSTLPPLPPSSHRNDEPIWSAAVMKKPSTSERDERRSERESSKRHSSSKKEKKSKKEKRSKDRKDRKRSRHSKKKRSSRRDDYSSSSSSSYSD